MLTVNEHPEWPDAKIAEHVGRNPGTLSRCPEYQAAASMARSRGAHMPGGHIEVNLDTGDRRIEAYGDD